MKSISTLNNARNKLKRVEKRGEIFMFAVRSSHQQSRGIKSYK